MADLEILALDEAAPEAQAPEGADRYLAKKAANFEQPITTDSTIDGRDVAADGALAQSATQPGDNNSTLTNDSGFEANADLASQAEAEAGTENTKTMTALRTAQAIAVLAAGIQNNYNAVVDPTTTDDDTQGYSPGSYWINTASEEVFRCVDASTNIAVWVETTLSSDDLAPVALSGDSDDLVEGVVQLLLTVAERAQIGNIQGWRDLEMSVTGAASGGGAPAQTAFGPTGNIKQTSFAINDSVYLAAHVPHDIKVGSMMYPHVHWSTSGTSLNSVKWQLSVINAAGHNQENFPADSLMTVEEAAHGTAWRHMITEHGVGVPAMEVDSLVIVELKRITNGGSENADTVFGLYVDFHYEAQQFATPSRTPDFYTP